MKKTYKVEIDCANCALKIEDAIRKVNGVNGCSINFVMAKMKLDLDDNCDLDSLLKTIEKTGKRVDSDFEIYK